MSSNLELNKGCTFVCEFEAYSERTGTPIDCEDYDFYMQVRKNNENGDVVLAFRIGIGLETEEHSILLKIEPEYTRDLIPGYHYVYDLKGVDKQQHTVYKFVEGDFIVNPEITRLEEFDE